MQHPEPEVLALAALGETLDEATRAHVDGCTECAAEVASYAGAVAVGRTVAAGEVLVAPPAHVWGRIRDELGLAADLEPSAAPDHGAVPEPVVEQDSPPAAFLPEQAEPPSPMPEPEPAPPGDEPPTAQVRTLRDRTARPSSGETRSLPVRWLAVAAAAGLVVGGGGVALWSNLGTPAPAVVEAAALEPLPDWTGASGEARVEVAADGSRSLVVTLGGAASDGGYHEVWLIDTGVTKLVSIGVLDGSTGTFALPPGLDLGEFPVVDISEEHFDGDPAHSGDSIVRGILET